MDNIDYKKLGMQIRSKRLDLKMSQEQLAEKSGLSTTHISNIENGKTKISLDTFVALCDIINISANKLLFSVANYKKSQRYDIETILSACSSRELNIIVDVIQSLVTSMRKNC